MFVLECKFKKDLSKIMNINLLQIAIRKFTKDMEFKDFIKVQWQACGEKLSLEAFICSFIHICVIKWKLKNKKKSVRDTIYLFSGASTGVLFWLISYPFDTIKTKM